MGFLCVADVLSESDSLSFLAGGGEMGALMRRHDWSATPLGVPEEWPQGLRTTVRLMLNTGHPMYLFWGPELACLYNDAYRPSLGTERHPGSLGRPARKVWDEIWDVIGWQLEQVMGGGSATWHVNQLVPMTRNGRLEDVYWTYSYGPIGEESAPNGIGGVLVVCTETTQQVQLAGALARSEERLRLALSGQRAIGIWDWDVVADRVVADERFARLYGVDPERARSGAPIAAFLDAVHPDDRQRLEASVERALRSGGSISEEYRLVGGDGERWVIAEGRCALGADGRPLRFPGVSVDITDRKMAENRLRELNADLERKVVERMLERGRTWQVSPEMLGVLNGGGFFETSNPAWGTILGWSEEEIARTVFFDFIHPDDLAKTRAAWDEAMQRGLPALRFENRYRCKDGSYRWLSWVAVPEGGKIYCSARDVTDEKQQAGALERAEEALRQAQKMDALGQLTGGVAHDFSNLLTVIQSSVDLLKRPNLTEERRQRYVAAISDTTKRAATLTGQLLAFARRQTLNPEVFDMSESVRGLGTMLATLTGARIEIETRLPEEACLVDADAAHFDTALVNMAVNARDAMGGEGKLTITVGGAARVPARRAHAALAGDFVTLSMRDTGVGIAREDFDRIFEPFFTTKEVGQGTGLGLSQVFGFVKQSGGEVGVESRPGQGTVFTLYLPRAPAGSLVRAQASEQTAVAGDGICVLVVEDNPDVGAFARQTLEELGYGSAVAPNGAAALALLAADAQRFDVVLSDVIMPGMSGVELAQEVGRRHAGLPVVLTSGYSQVLARTGTAGFTLLQKPYSIEQLSRVLMRAAADRRRG